MTCIYAPSRGFWQIPHLFKKALDAQRLPFEPGLPRAFLLLEMTSLQSPGFSISIFRFAFYFLVLFILY
jgi:hypothetical protein